ncbi:hypothetical protein Q8A67_013466 [Cirrhinus molitorella]|uniref:Uncharacterized protein n=1 Tax=Cirrhinus molitorella TaxID=172907 RepID=A0AA88PL86_9TELE|nr:hypothetical protein Q8A67_013466 [Cirrhinus molitorella]
MATQTVTRLPPWGPPARGARALSVSIHGQCLQPGSVSAAHMTGTRSHDQCFQRKLVSIHPDVAEILRFITS